MSVLTQTMPSSAHRHAETVPRKRRSLIADVERELRECGSPYVSVDKAKKALFAQARLKAFHFVVYEKQGGNWLLWCGKPTALVRQDMGQWAEVFGDGFQVVYAVRRRCGIVYKSGSDTRLTLDGGVAACSTPCPRSAHPRPPAHKPAVPEE